MKPSEKVKFRVLIDKWREETRKALEEGLNGYAAGNTDCADELEAVIEEIDE